MITIGCITIIVIGTLAFQNQYIRMKKELIINDTTLGLAVIKMNEEIDTIKTNMDTMKINFNALKKEVDGLSTKVTFGR